MLDMKMEREQLLETKVRNVLLFMCCTCIDGGTKTHLVKTRGSSAI